MAKTTISIACCQFAPELAEPTKNAAKATQLISSLKPGQVQFLILPEMAFSGYAFRSKEHIEPFLEDAETGLTVTWARETAIRLQCHVVVGYPRRDKESETNFNSCCVVDAKGTLLLTYDKHFLYETDETWAKEGAGFTTIEIPEIGKVGFGICMDINPYKFTAPWEAFEFANYHVAANTRLLLMPMAWLDSETRSNNVYNLPNYWASRLTPLIGKPCVVVTCNRTGGEGSVQYAGCSCVVSLQKPVLISQLNKKQENVLVTEVELP
ncbi:hypothetical protein CAOG_02983 [Capsaspora owczarzaki ATCC 30864]|nr:hypothetical protein CAOG_02983 [Capsaspora owczarzaki ATCC 30864]|eukprot:XP_004363822.2 hypothetical protein CAOG_02983 [Capsaspora owczarzaki ATCC 30864]